MKLYHPVLGRTINVPPRTAKIWLRSGWRLTPTPEMRAAQVADDPVDESSTPDVGEPNNPLPEEE